MFRLKDKKKTFKTIVLIPLFGVAILNLIILITLFSLFVSGLGANSLQKTAFQKAQKKCGADPVVVIDNGRSWSDGVNEEYTLYTKNNPKYPTEKVATRTHNPIAAALGANGGVKYYACSITEAKAIYSAYPTSQIDKLYDPIENYTPAEQLAQKQETYNKYWTSSLYMPTVGTVKPGSFTISEGGYAYTLNVVSSSINVFCTKIGPVFNVDTIMSEVNSVGNNTFGIPVKSSGPGDWSTYLGSDPQNYLLCGFTTSGTDKSSVSNPQFMEIINSIKPTTDISALN